MTPRTKAAQPASRLRIVSLGGVDEIGKNMTVFEYEDDIVVVDCGSIFPKEDMLGVDLVIPDVSYLVEKKRNVRGYLFTHGHEDHIGATPYILRQVPAPLYGTKLTLALVDLKLKEHRIQGIPMQVVQPRDEVRLGKNFTAKFIHVSHSIAGACAIALTCPAGTVVVTGDFKIDYTPVDGHITDLASFAELGERGVVFATHADSQKGRELAQNPWASGVLYWRESSQQIILNGRAERLPDERADAQWLSRPYQTHPMSIASRQSETLADIHALRAEARRLAETDGPLPRPPGYCLFELCLESVEFWGNGTERLHERLRYDRDEGGWKHRYLQP